MLGAMANSEARRRDLYNGLDDLLGTERADTLMAYLPAYETIEVATKDDIRRLEDRLNAIDGRFDRIDDRFDRMDDRFDRTDDRFDRMDDRLDRIEGRLDRFFLTQSAGLIAMVGTLVAALLL